MYSFRDTIDHTDLVENLPSEAMNFDGVFLENVVKGYKTLSVSGRETLSRNLETVKVGRADGETFKSSSLDAREIEVKFVVYAGTPEDLQVQMTKVKASLYKKQSQIYFNDDKTRYITGIVSEVKTSSEGTVIGTGSIIIYSTDPNWYTFLETKVSTTSGTAKIEYEGSYPSKPRIAVTMNSDNGFVGLIDGKGSLLQFGTVEEIDGTIEKKSVYGISDIRANDFTEAEYAPRGWKTNVAPALMVANFQDVVQTGTLEFGIFEHLSNDKWKGQKVPYITGGDWGTGTGWHGPSMTRDFTPDVGGKNTAKDFTASFEENFIIGAVGQVGCQQMMINTPDGKNVAGIVMYKNVTVNNDTVLEYFIGGKSVHTQILNPVNTDLTTGWDGGAFKIEKFGDKLTFSNPLNINTYSLNPTQQALEAKSVSIYFGQFGKGGNPSVIVGTGVTHNYMKSIRFVQHNVPYFNDIPNRFGKGDLLVIDTSTGSVSLNGLPQSSLGALGNDWEEFGIDTGSNTITCVNSSFATPPPIYDFYYKGVNV